MNKKIYGATVGTPLPKPNLMQTDPAKGDFVRGKEAIPTKVSQLVNDSGYLTDEDKAEIVDAVKNETKQKYGKLIVFGDSLAEGENNNSYSFVDVLRESGLFTSVVKASRSGATIGPYQTDAHADGYDLISQIERYAADVVNAEIILCEYQYNDVKAVVDNNISMGFKHNTADTETVCGYMRSALNRIRELNPTVHIVWMPSVKSDWNFASLTTDVKDYLMLFEATALSVAKEYGVGIISVMENLFNPALLSSDNIHPNSEGHERIAQIILHNLYADTDLMLPERLLIMYGDLEQPSSMVIDGSAPIIATMMEAGIRVRLAWNGGSGAILFDAVLANYQGIIFRSDGGSFGNFTVVWGLNGKINFQQGSGTGASSWNDLTDKPDIPTDEHINSLIDAKLGVIENAYY